MGSLFSCCHNYNKGRFGFFFSCYHKYNRWSRWVHYFLAAIITIREGLGFSFLVTISTIGGGIYLRFLSRCNDEKEQQFFDKG